MRIPVPLAILPPFLVLASGCFAPATLAAPEAPLLGAGASPRESGGAWSLSFGVSGCEQFRYFQTRPVDALSALLPEGYRPVPASRALAMLGLPLPPVPIEAGDGLALFDAARCAEGDLDGVSAPTGFSNAVVFIETPELPEGSLRPGPVDLYQLDIWLTSPAWVDAFRAAAFGSGARGAVVEIDPSPRGEGALLVDGAPIGKVEWLAPLSTRYAPAPFRLWHEAANGTSYYESVEDDVYVIGAATSCSFAPGSIPERLFGGTTCEGDAGFVVNGLATRIRGTLHHLPGTSVA